LVQRGGAWAGCSPAQSPPRCTKCNNLPINGQCTNFLSFDVAHAFALYAVNDYRDDIPQSCVVNLLQPISTGFNILKNYYADLPIGDSKTYCFLSVRYNFTCVRAVNENICDQHIIVEIFGCVSSSLGCGLGRAEPVHVQAPLVVFFGLDLFYAIPRKLYN